MSLSCVLFQSRYREAFHFRSPFAWRRRIRPTFQSRYREAFHFRATCFELAAVTRIVSISLSRGFSFQGKARPKRITICISFNLVIERLFSSGKNPPLNLRQAEAFQSRYREAFHFRDASVLVFNVNREVSISLSRGFSFQERNPLEPTGTHPSFNLVIERLFISGLVDPSSHWMTGLKFQSRYREAFHFRLGPDRRGADVHIRFNLVIERLFISGPCLRSR